LGFIVGVVGFYLGLKGNNNGTIKVGVVVIVLRKSIHSL